jgi:hypothetical protein
MAVISHKQTLPMLQEVREKIKKSDVIADLCKEYGVDIDYIDLIPMAFTDLDVSARTEKGCIYFNIELLQDGFENDDHYMAHEVVHHFQQCFGDGPTKGSGDSEDYLDNEYEQEGFQAQTEYLSETRDDQAAVNYVEQVLNHHDVDEQDKNKRRKDLLNIAQQLTE